MTNNNTLINKQTISTNNTQTHNKNTNIPKKKKMRNNNITYQDLTCLKLPET